MQLLGAIAPGAEDRICFVGDLIDRGPKSAHVVDFVMNSPYECLLGNHEKMLLDIFSDGHLSQAALHGWLFSGGQATLASYQDFFGEAGIPQNHIDWIYQRPLYADWGDYWIVHAGVNPQLPLEAQTAQDFCWIREPFHAINQPYFADKTIVTGHTITFTMPGVMPGNVARGEGWIDIDTGAYHPRSGWLSALDLTHQKVYQVHVYEPKLRVRSLEEASTPIQRDHIAIAH
ncbi:MAG: metallophosphoesterase family protein [Cyanophyceae cyanobacterium]